MSRPQTNSFFWFVFLAAFISFGCRAATTAMSPEELEHWFNGNGTSEVNEGELKFLATPPEKPVHHHQNHIRITLESLKDGWTELEQCHDKLDAVPDAQITFREGYVRNLQVLEARSIAKAWVEGSTIQLKGVLPGARLCLKAQTRALKNAGNGFFNLNNGPYMRKFLDGYYPMRVSIQVEYPEKLMQLIDVSPARQPGFEVWQLPGRVAIETFFEGELRTLLQFELLR